MNPKRRGKSAVVGAALVGNRTKAAHAIDLAQEAGTSFWHDADGEAFADVYQRDDVRQTMRVRSRDFRTWLSGLVFRAGGGALGGQHGTDAVNVLSDLAVHDGPERKVYVRIAQGADAAVYLDLGDPTWRAVEITARGWRIVPEPPVRFRRPRALRALPVPKRGGDFDELRRALSIEDGRDWILLISWLAGALHPFGPYPILLLTGEQGTAKSTTGRVLRSLVDPSEAPLRSPPRDDQALIVAAKNGQVIGLDNISRIPEWLSDALCRIATGGGYSARQLYTDGDEVVYADRRPIIMTSIEDVLTRGDLADRSISITLPTIPDSARRTEADLDSELDRIRPGVLGALLDALSTGLRRQHGIRFETLPRMADFAAWVVACEPALPWKPGGFLEAYSEARNETVQSSIDADLVASALVTFMEQRTEWQGTAMQLLEDLNRVWPEGALVPKAWPQSPRGLSGRVTRAAPMLREAGIGVERGKRGDRFIHLTREAPAVALEQEAQSGTDPSDISPQDETVGTQRDGADGCLYARANCSPQTNLLDEDVLGAGPRGDGGDSQTVRGIEL